jgi:cell volume regulation protein A
LRWALSSVDPAAVNCSRKLSLIVRFRYDRAGAHPFRWWLEYSVALLNRGLVPAAPLATIGVVTSSALFAVSCRLLDFSWNQAFLLGAIVAPTDAAAVFPILRSSGLQLKKRIATTLELEAGLKDPVAVALTIALSQALAYHQPVSPAAVVGIPIGLVVGSLVGIAVGYGGRLLLLHSHY